MSDLISRKAMYKALHSLGGCDAGDEWSKGWDEAINEAINELNHIPAAYDVDKVVERLEEARDELLHSTDYNNDIINYCLDLFDMAIDIVKGAVKDE